MVRIVSLLLILLFILAGCGKKEKIRYVEYGEKSDYTIRIKTFSNQDSAEKYSEILKVKDSDANARKMNSLKNADLQITSLVAPEDTAKTTNRYALEIGGFSSSFSAGKMAFDLQHQGILTGYSLTFNRVPVYDEFANIFFIGEHKNYPSVFTYNLNNKQNKMFWSNPGESVVELNSSKDGKTAFFLTASDYGRKTIFPYINNVKIYRIDAASQTVEKLRELGNGVQLFTNWETPGSFRIVFNQFDVKRSTFIIQTRLVFSTSGKLLSNEKVTYDIVKEKYPVPSSAGSDISSSGGKYDLLVSSYKNRNVLTLVDSTKNKKDIYTTTDNINSTDWWGNGKYFIFSTYDSNPGNKTFKGSNPLTSNLCIFSTQEGKILHSWKGGGYKNFLLRGDLLFFDDGFNNNSKILIYNLIENKITDTIAIRGGCGIRNIPTIPY